MDGDTSEEMDTRRAVVGGLARKLTGRLDGESNVFMTCPVVRCHGELDRKSFQSRW